jgi:hypothetical protein
MPTFQWRRDRTDSRRDRNELHAAGHRPEDDGTTFDVVVGNQFGNTTSNPRC